MNRKTFNLKILPLLGIILTLLLIFSISATSVAYAQDAETSGTYGGVDTSTLWYYGEDALDINNVLNGEGGIASWNLDSNEALRNSLKAKPIVIAVVDTGCNYNHEIFDGLLLRDANNEVVRYNSYNAVQSSGKTDDVTDKASDLHGTAIMGAIAVIIKDLGLQDYIKLVPIKASYTTKSKKESFPLSATREAIRYAFNDIGADIINFSYGILGSKVDKSPASKTNWISDSDLLNTMDVAANSSVLIAAAGNDDADSSNSANDAYYIAAHSNVIGVMGYNEHIQKAANSSFGTKYDIYAPSTNIFTAGTGSKGYKTGSGTSYASAIVSAVTAVYEVRVKVDKFINNNSDPINARNVTRTIRQHSSSKIPYSYKINEGTVNEKTISYMQDKLDVYKLLTADFSHIDDQYEEVTGVSISQTGTKFKPVTDDVLGTIFVAEVGIHDTEGIVVQATLKPQNGTDPALDKNITWIIEDDNGNKKIIATGRELSYVVTKEDVFDATTEVCRLKVVAEYASFRDTWYVDFKFDAYNNNSSVQIVAKGINSDGVVYLNKPVTLSISGMEYINTNAGIIWYVNDEIYATTKTPTLTFNPKEAGTYTISAQYALYGQKILNVVTIKVERNIWLIATLSVTGGIVLIALILVLVVLIKKKASSKIKIKEPKPAEETEKAEEADQTETVDINE